MLDDVTERLMLLVMDACDDGFKLRCSVIAFVPCGSFSIG